MSNSWNAVEDDAERRTRLARSTPDQRLAALRQLQRLAVGSGAWQRVLREKADAQESQWKSAEVMDGKVVEL